jgi:hypothetical protein
MGLFSKKEEQTITVSNDQVDQKQAQLEKQGYEVSGEKTVKGGKTEIFYRPDPDKQKSK